MLRVRVHHCGQGGVQRHAEAFYPTATGAKPGVEVLFPPSQPRFARGGPGLVILGEVLPVVVVKVVEIALPPPGLKTAPVTLRAACFDQVL